MNNPLKAQKIIKEILYFKRQLATIKKLKKNNNKNKIVQFRIKIRVKIVKNRYKINKNSKTVQKIQRNKKNTVKKVKKYKKIKNLKNQFDICI